MSYQIIDCQTLSPELLCGSMNAAFSDYVVPLFMTEAGFVDFQKQRDFSAPHSFVAMEEGNIAAFWFSGRPDPVYGNRAYTLSVGTLPAHRRKGLSRQLLDAVVEAQRAEKASGLQLEVVTTNARAVSAYETFGFSRQRKLRVCKLAIDDLKPPELSDVSFCKLKVEDLPVDPTFFFESSPTPQNSRSALIGLADKSLIHGARKGEDLIGWAALYSDGAVAQVAVHEAHRRQGIGQGMLYGAARAADVEQLTFVNVDDATPSINAFLDRLGAEDILQQYEMHLDL